jgi:hypothetical protein
VPREVRSASHGSRVINEWKGPESDPGHVVSGASLEMISVCVGPTRATWLPEQRFPFILESREAMMARGGYSEIVA